MLGAVACTCVLSIGIPTGTYEYMYKSYTICSTVLYSIVPWYVRTVLVPGRRSLQLYMYACTALRQTCGPTRSSTILRTAAATGGPVRHEARSACVEAT